MITCHSIPVSLNRELIQVSGGFSFSITGILVKQNGPVKVLLNGDYVESTCVSLDLIFGNHWPIINVYV